MFNVISDNKLINSMRQASNLERLLCKSKFMLIEENFHVSSCGKNCVCCPYVLKAHLFKWVNKVFFLKNNLNCESRNRIYVVICEGCKEEYIGETACLVKERIKGEKCLQATQAATISTNKSGRTSSPLF